MEYIYCEARTTKTNCRVLCRVAVVRSSFITRNIYHPGLPRFFSIPTNIKQPKDDPSANPGGFLENIGPVRRELSLRVVGFNTFRIRLPVPCEIETLS